MRRGILCADCGKPLQSEARRGVHGQVENDHFGFAYRGFVKRLAGKIETANEVSAFPQPSGGRSEAERLTAQFVCREQENFHDNDSITRDLERLTGEGRTVNNEEDELGDGPRTVIRASLGAACCPLRRVLCIGQRVSVLL
jgi:hypothetical protein